MALQLRLGETSLFWEVFIWYITFMEKDIVKALQDADLLQYFKSLPQSHQKEYLKWINEAKKAETRNKRISKTVEMLRQK